MDVIRIYTHILFPYISHNDYECNLHYALLWCFLRPYMAAINMIETQKVLSAGSDLESWTANTLSELEHYKIPWFWSRAHQISSFWLLFWAYMFDCMLNNMFFVHESCCIGSKIAKPKIVWICLVSLANGWAYVGSGWWVFRIFRRSWPWALDPSSLYRTCLHHQISMIEA